MRKTNLNIKRMEFIKKLCVFLLIQVALILCFNLIMTYGTGEIQNPNTSTIIVDQISYEYKFMNGRMFSVFSNGNEYSFLKIAVADTNEYSMQELFENISIGDELVIDYVENRSSYLIIGARKNGEVLRSIEEYNKFAKKQHILGVIAFVTIELIFVAVFILFVILYGKGLKLFKKRTQKVK